MITLDAVRAMTDAEFAEANRRRAWRETLGTLPAAETAPGEARLFGRTLLRPAAQDLRTIELKA